MIIQNLFTTVVSAAAGSGNVTILGACIGEGV